MASELGLCLSHSKTINLVDILGKDYDLDVIVAGMDYSFNRTDEEILTVSCTSCGAHHLASMNCVLSVNAGYKLVFENIKLWYMQSNSQTLSLHYVKMYGVNDEWTIPLFHHRSTLKQMSTVFLLV